MSAPDVRKPGWSPANAGNKIDGPIVGHDLSADKQFRTLQALFALRGLELNLIRRRGGCSYLEARCHLRCWCFASLHDAQAFLARQPGGDPV